MTLDAIKDKINKFLHSDSKSVRLVNFQQSNELVEFVQHFSVGSTKIVSAESFCADDESECLTDIVRFLRTTNEKIILTGFSTLLRLSGDKTLKRQLDTWCEGGVGSAVVIVCFQCKELFNEISKDPRYRQNLLSSDEGSLSSIELVFAHIPKDSLLLKQATNGVQNIVAAIEKQGKTKILVNTNKTKKQYPESGYRITELHNNYQLAVEAFHDLSVVQSTCGTDEQWANLLKLCLRHKNIETVMRKHIGSIDDLATVFSKWDSLSDDKRWLLFIALKLYGAQNSRCLSIAVNKSKNVEDIPNQLYRSIVDIKHTDKGFWEAYAERKEFLKIVNASSSAADFCEYIDYKGSAAIYYLTDLTTVEKEKIFAWIDRYCNEISDNDLMDILKNIYHDLYSYLQPYRFNEALLDGYFTKYKMQKVRNVIYPDFEELVQSEAVERNFNKILPTRTEVIDRVDKNGAILYFLDALGVEFISYIMAKCAEKKLHAKVKVCKCNLPSLTRCNKEFLEVFRNAGAVVVDNIKELDEIKHHGKFDYDYCRTKLPIHLTKELEIIAELLEKVELQLKNGKFKKAYIVSDHGASRLAVISEKTLELEVDSKGTNGGRVCAYTKEVSAIPQVMIQDGYCILANYNRFKGGRAASVETHGGATLEEVVVPVIELTNATINWEFIIKTPIVSVSFRKKAELNIYSKIAVDNMAIMLNGNFYDGVINSDKIFKFNIEEFKQPGKYVFDIYVDNNLVQSGLVFEIKKEGLGQNNLL